MRDQEVLDTIYEADEDDAIDSRMVFLSRLRRTRLLALLASARVVQRPPPVPFISVLMRPSAMSSFQGKGS